MNSTRKKRTIDDYEFIQQKTNGKLQDELGKGAFGMVRLAKDKISGQKVAIKTIPKKVLKEQSSAEYLKREIRLQKKLDHSHIVKLYHSFEDTENVYLALEYVQNGNLFFYLRKRRKLEENEAFVYFIQTCLGIDYLHKKNIIHRDLKPENILLDAQGNIKICDFGWSAELAAERHTFCGTLDYMSPEMLNNRPHDHRVDIWALGVLLYELLHGQAPFSQPRANKESIIKSIMSAGSTPLQFGSDVSSGAKNLITLLLKADPDQRATLQDIFRNEWVQKQAKNLNLDLEEYIYEKGVNETIQSLQESFTITMPKPTFQDLFEPKKERDKSPSLLPSIASQQSDNRSRSKSPIVLTPELQKQKDLLLGNDQQRQNNFMEKSNRTERSDNSKTPDIKKSIMGSGTLSKSPDVSPNTRKRIFDDKQQMGTSQIIQKYTQQPQMFASQDFGDEQMRKDAELQRRLKREELIRKQRQDEEQQKIMEKQKQQEELFKSQEQDRKLREQEQQRQAEELRKQEQQRKQREQDILQQQLILKQQQEFEEQQKKIRDQELEKQRKDFEEQQNRLRQQEMERSQREFEVQQRKQRDQEKEKQRKDYEDQQKKIKEQEIIKQQREFEEKQRKIQEYEDQQRKIREYEDQQRLLKQQEKDKKIREYEEQQRKIKEQENQRKIQQYEEQQRLIKLEQQQKNKRDQELQIQEQQQQQQINAQKQLELKKYQEQMEQQRIIKEYQEKQLLIKAQEEQLRKDYEEYQRQLNKKEEPQTKTRQLAEEEIFTLDNKNSYVPQKAQFQQDQEDEEFEQRLDNLLVQNLQLDLPPKPMKHEDSMMQQNKLEWDVSVIEAQQQLMLQSQQFNQEQQYQQHYQLQEQQQQQQQSQSQNQQNDKSPRQTRFTPRKTQMENRTTYIGEIIDDQLDEWDLSDNPQIKLLNQLNTSSTREKKVKKVQPQVQQVKQVAPPKFSFGESKALENKVQISLEDSYQQEKEFRKLNRSRDQSSKRDRSFQSSREITRHNNKHPTQNQNASNIEEEYNEEDLEKLKRSKSTEQQQDQNNTFDNKLQPFSKYDCDPYSQSMMNSQDLYKPRKTRISERQQRVIPNHQMEDMDFFDRLKFAFGCLNRRQ